MLNPKIAAAKNIPEALITAGGIFDSHEAMRFKTSPEDKYSGKYSFKQVGNIPRVIGTVMVEKYGMKPEQKIGFISEDRPEYNLGDFGVMCGGGISWGLYDYDVKAQDIIEYKLNDSETEIIVTSPAFLDPMRAVVRGGKTPLKHLIVMDMPHDRIDYQQNETPFSDILKSGIEDVDLIAERLRTVDRDSVARLIYTSGTTGKPKGVMLTHNNLLSNVQDASKLLRMEPGERVVAYLPEAHSFQGFISLCALLNGAALWYSHKKSIVEDMPLIEPTLFPGVPLVFKRFAEGMRAKVLALTKGHIDLAADYSGNFIKAFLRRKVLGPIVVKKIGFGKLKDAVSGSAKLELDHASVLENIGIRIMEGYGISETSPVISCESRHSGMRRGSVGNAIPGVDVKILSLEEAADGTRAEMPVGEQGEVVVKGPNVFKGYYRDEAKTAKAFYKGYYKTGDRGNLDKDGFLYIHGRCGLQVKMANGEFVDLDEMAADILRHSMLIQAAAVDAELKEFPIAVVSLQWEPEALTEIGAKLGVPFSGNPVEFASNEKVIAAIKKEIEEIEPKIGAPRNPKAPKKYLIVAPMSPETGEITSTLKFRVRTILDKYREQLNKLRKSDDKYMVYIK